MDQRSDLLVLFCDCIGRGERARRSIFWMSIELGGGWARDYRSQFKSNIQVWYF